jgi:glycosyltransferase involved in cell wall biosynthesis
MRILIDFTPVPKQRTGVGMYAENLVKELTRLVDSNDMLLLLAQDDEIVLRGMVAGLPRVRMLVIPSKWFRKRFLLFGFEQFVLPFILFFHHVDVLHSLHYTHPIISPSRRVVTVHDLTFLLFPHLHTRFRRLVIPVFIKRAMKHSESVIFVSSATKTDAERLLSGGSGLRSVVPLGVDARLFESMDDAPVHKTLERLGLSHPFILYVGTIEPRKNLVRLIKAFEAIAPHHNQLRLVLAGRLGWNYTETLEAMKSSSCADRIRYFGFISEEDKRALLKSCEILIYPSLYEGFGLPVLEAMAAGAPVITSRLSSLPEVAGDAAVLVDPYSVSELTEALYRTLASSSERCRMRVAGRRQAAGLTWKATAALTYQVYLSVLKHQESEVECEAARHFGGE